MESFHKNARHVKGFSCQVKRVWREFLFCLARASCRLRRDGLVKELVCLGHGVKRKEFSYQFPLILENFSDTVGKRSGKLVNSNSICMDLKKPLKFRSCLWGFKPKQHFCFDFFTDIRFP